MMLVDAPARQIASAMQTSVSSRSNSGGVVLTGILDLRPPVGKDIKGVKGVRFHLRDFRTVLRIFRFQRSASPARPGLGRG